MSSGQIEIHVKGKPVRVPAAQIDGRTVLATGKWLRDSNRSGRGTDRKRICRRSEVVPLAIEGIRTERRYFTFSQKVWDNTPKYSYPLEWDNWAVIPITTYADWEKRAESSVRRAVRRAAKLGVVVKVAEFDDTFCKRDRQYQQRDSGKAGRTFGTSRKALRPSNRKTQLTRDEIRSSAPTSRMN